MANVVQVKNISAQTSEKEVRDFFSFCGKISNLEITNADESQNATVTFEKETAAKTALLLDNTQLGSTHVQVTSASGLNQDDTAHPPHPHEQDSDEIRQEEKPRSRIVAEYLAHGYVVGDVAIQRAIDLDQKHGVSQRFLTTLKHLDDKYHGTERARSVDQSYGVTAKANSFLSGLSSYYEKATSTPTGRKFADFYTQTARQVQDIHNEARRLADIKKAQQSGGSTCKCGSDSKKCDCAPGTCACENCVKEGPKPDSSGETKSGEESVKNIPGTEKSVCNCGGNDSTCACQQGKCTCSGCAKKEISAS